MHYEEIVHRVHQRMLPARADFDFRSAPFRAPLAAVVGGAITKDLVVLVK
jgi:hypothetical protein